MKKPVLFFVTLLISLSILADIYCNALSAYSLSGLDGCSNTAVESNSSGAYAYGSNGKNVYITKLLPDMASYSVTLEGKVKALCMDNNTLCALYTVNTSLSLMRLNADNGSYKTYSLGKISVFSQGIFAVSDSRVYLLSTGRAYTYVSAYEFDGGHITDYSFSQNAIDLFTNSGDSYVRMYDGSIYRLDNSEARYCASVSKGVKISNAGAGWIFDNTSELCSLSGNGNTLYISGGAYGCVVLENTVYYVSGNGAYSRELSSDKIKYCDIEGRAEHIAAYSGNAAVINDGYTKLTVASSGEFKSASESLQGGIIQGTDVPSGSADYIISENENIIFNIKSGTSAAEFKKYFSENISVTTASGSAVTSGKMKTGYCVKINSKTYTASVSGDLTGEGNVNSRDINLLMDYITGASEISGAYKKAADYNIDGRIDNIDLVMISRNTD